jgi:twitching motility protein PilT
MRDLETIATALTAAETGHLVIATLHTASAMQTVERIVDVFPPVQQNQVITQLANTIQGVIAQLLLPRADKKGRALATEILIANTAVRSIIRDNNLPQLATVMQTGRKAGMQTMDECLRGLYERAEISYDILMAHAHDGHMMKHQQGASSVQ